MSIQTGVQAGADRHARLHGLIRDSRSGDPEAFAELYAAHVVRVRQYARRLGPAHGVEDLVSEAFARTWQQLRAGRGPDRAFMAYLRAVVLRLHLDGLRRDQRLTWVAQLDDAAIADPDLAAKVAEQTPEYLALEQLFNQRMKDALTTLPERWRDILVMVYVQDLPYPTVAGHFGLTVPAARQLAHRARMGMRQALADLAPRAVAAA